MVDEIAVGPVAGVEAFHREVRMRARFPGEVLRAFEQVGFDFRRFLHNVLDLQPVNLQRISPPTSVL
jgi:hypothetical protein